MKKMISILLCAMLAIGCLAGCGAAESPYESVNTVDGITVSVNEQSVSPTGLDIEILNETDHSYYYGAWYRVERLDGKKWVSVDPVSEWGQNDWIKEVPSQTAASETYEWEWYYGTLPDGEYRLVIGLYSEVGPEMEPTYHTAEFELK